MLKKESFFFSCRSKETDRDDFIFYSKRLMRLLIEDVMSMLPFQTVTVDTPQKFRYEGKRLNVKQVDIIIILFCDSSYISMIEILFKSCLPFRNWSAEDNSYNDATFLSLCLFYSYYI